jgi:hypothetical protein
MAILEILFERGIGVFEREAAVMLYDEGTNACPCNTIV